MSERGDIIEGNKQREAVTPLGDIQEVTLVNQDGTVATLGGGGGTQYADGVTQATPTGNAILWKDGSNVLHVPSTANPIPVQQGNLTAALDTVTAVGTVGSGVTDSGNPVKAGAVYNSTQPTVTTGQRVDAQSTARGELLVSPGTSGFNIFNSGGHVALDAGSSTVGNVGSSTATGAATPANAFYIAGANGGNLRGLVTDGSGNLQVNIAAGGLSYGTVSLTPATTGGWTASLQAALTNTAAAVKASAGSFGGYFIYNPNATVIYVQVFNVASGSVTLGTTTPTLSLGIPATSAANLEIANGVAFSTAISIAATTTATGSTAPATALVANLFYK